MRITALRPIGNLQAVSKLPNQDQWYSLIQQLFSLWFRHWFQRGVHSSSTPWRVFSIFDLRGFAPLIAGSIASRSEVVHGSNPLGEG